MSIASRARDRAKNGYRAAPNTSTRPRIYGFLSTPDRFDLTAWQDQSHRANRLQLTHRKGSGLGFGGIGCRLSGMAPKPRKGRRKLLRLSNWMRRDAARRALDTAPAVKAAAPAVASEAKPASVASKVSRFFGRVLGRKGGR